jgi:nitrite reductase/ring-hydroxylating ferredoxin subunit
MSKALGFGEQEIGEGQTVTFTFERDGKPVQGFLARYQGELLAYENECRHVPLTLDYGDSQFFTKDGKHFVCQTHGALYEPATGRCVQGPCPGAMLKALAIEVRNGKVFLLG